MAWEQKEGQGALFKNEKQKDSHPDYRGDAMVGGTVYEIAGWIKKGAKGNFLSLAIKPKGQKKDSQVPF